MKFPFNKIVRGHRLQLGAGMLVFVSLAARFAYSQDSQFAFDASGNLLSATLEPAALPQIIGQPQMQVVAPGQSASFSVVVADTRAVSYQWYFSNSPISMATSDALFITNVSASNEGFYWVAVSNAVGSTASTLANLYVDSRGCGMPDSWQLQYFGNLNQNALGDYDGDGVSNLQEFLDGTNPTNAASALYRIVLVNDGGIVTISPDQATYNSGQMVTLTATSTNSNPFHAWTGDVVTRGSSITVSMTNNLNLFAHFLPFTLVWTKLADGDWNDAPNWSPNLAPISNESVIIGYGGPGAALPTITQNSNVDLVDFTFGNDSWAPVLTGSGRITISGTGIWNSGTMSGNGAIVVEPDASLTLANSSSLALNRTLENAGSVAWVGGNISLGGVITNDAGAQFTIAGPASLNFGGGASRFDNAGALTLVYGATTFAGVAFDDYGTVDFPGGTLTLSGGGVLANSLVVPAGSSINFEAGTFTSTTNLSLTGGGTLFVSTGTLTLSGVVNLSGSNIFADGSIELNGSYVCTNNALIISGGVVNFDGTSLVSPSVIDLSNGSLGGSNDVTVGSAMTWTGGGMSGTGRTFIPPGVTLTISNPSFISLSSRTLDNAGTVTWSGANMNMSDGVITNEPGALFEVQSPTFIGWSGGFPRIDNAGTFNTAVSGTTALGAALNNYNTLTIQGGTLLLQGGGNNTGTISVPAGTTINFGGGTFTSSGSASISGSGSLIVSGGNSTLSGMVNMTGSNIFSNGSAELNGDYVCSNNALTVSGATVGFDGTGTVAPAVLNLTGGLLSGAQDVTVGAAMSWTGGGMSGTGRTIILLGSTLSISNPSPVSMPITSRTLDNGGTVIWIGPGPISLDDAVITNRLGAVFNAQNAAAIYFGGGSPRFDNAGVFRKTVSAGTLTLNEVNFTNYGLVDIQSGVLLANIGSFGSALGAVLNFGIAGPIPATNYGQLQATGPIALNGALSLNLANNYVPSANDSFTLVTAGAINGVFSDFLYPSNVVTLQLSNTTNSVVVLVSGNTPPDRVLVPPQVLGTNLNLCWGARSNVTYRVEINPTLDPTTWVALPGDVTSSGNIACKTDVLTSSNRFYRIVIVP